MQPTARENSMENPSNVDKGYSVNQGMGVDIVHRNNITIECNANMLELIAETEELNANMGPKNMLIGQSNTEINERVDKVMDQIENIEGLLGLTPVESSEHVVFNSNTLLDKDGPSNFKPEGTWTRINRMEFGLGGFTIAITIPRLGKRSSREMQEGQVDVQATKRGKVGSDDGSTDFISVRVESHPYQEP